MRVIFDTNILISREQNDIVSNELQELSKVLERLNHQKYVHPLSFDELSRDKNERRKEVHLSKIGSYLVLKDPPDPKNDSAFLSTLDIDKLKDEHEIVDCSLLYCIIRNAAHFLITEDKQILRKAEKLGIAHRIFNIEEALEHFKKVFLPPKIKPISPPAVKEVFAYNLDLNDSFFDSIKEDYGEEKFTDWWEKISLEERKAHVYYENGKIGALLVYKLEEENELTECTPQLPNKKMLKVCTLKVAHFGFKLGELFIKLAVDFTIKNNLYDMYLTHFTKENDLLVSLIEEFGFKKYGISPYDKNGKTEDEDVFYKKLIPDRTCQSPIDIQKEFYPSLYDGGDVKKFVIPIEPQYHNRLFTDYRRRQPLLDEFNGGLITEGNTIKKAYLCHAVTKKVSPGDVSVFYRSHDEKALTSIGVVEKILYDVTDPDVIAIEVGKRTVYTREEIEFMAKKPTTIILFNLNFHFSRAIKLYDLQAKGILTNAPRSIQEIHQKNYLKIREMSGIDKRFFIDTLEV